MKRILRTGIFPVLFLFFGSLRLEAQYAVRSWLPWRTVETAHFEFHYPVELEAWTLHVASRMEAIDSAVSRVVGYTPARKTHVVVDDPYEIANGSAWPFLNRPVINLWATPPDPREDIGEFRIWGDVLIAHEFTHIAHLTRPSRNALMRRLWEALPADVGPIALDAPRWAMEGYATYVEGKVTGSGRPRGVWRAAYLRQWAIEGALPRYENLDGWGAYDGGEFAYLAGSAFFEWLVQRPGMSDSSLVYLWRRMTAKQPRSFDDAFVGVFGESPRILYGLFTADLTAGALAAAKRLHAPGADTGTVVQRLAWGTGDPAMSPDGQHVAIVLRSPAHPSRVVIWRTTAEPDTGRARRDSLLRKSDPEDVPARPIYPPPKHAIAVLTSNGNSYEDPRFLRDGRILLWKNSPTGDGSERPDLYVWDPRRRTVRRITHGASVRDADPTPDGRTAYAMRCHAGACDLVSVSLNTGAVTTVLPGSPTTSFYRPRVRPIGDDILVSVHDSTRWHLAIVNARTRALRILVPDDTVNSYDGAWASANEITAVTEAGGVPNIEFFNIDAPMPGPITRLTGAAVAPEANPRNGSIWFLSLYSRGYDLRQIADPRRTVDRSAPSLAGLLPEIARVAPRDTAPFGVNSVSLPRPFDLGVRSFRWIPAPQIDADGLNGLLGLASADLIGRSEILGKLAFGDKATWRGGALDLTWRGMRPFVSAELYDAVQTPSASRSSIGSRLPTSTALDAQLLGGELSLDGMREYESWAAAYRAGTSVGRIDQDGGSTRTLLFGDGNFTFVQRADRSSSSQSIGADVTAGNSFGQRFYRGVGRASLSTAGPGSLPLTISATYARTSADAPPFEQIALGGSASSLLDGALLTQRIAMPALPTGIQSGPSALAYRVTFRSQPVNWFFWAGSTARLDQRFSQWNRVAGVDWAMSIPAIPLAGTPRARGEYGLGYSLDEPFRNKLRGYVSLVLNP